MVHLVGAMHGYEERNLFTGSVRAISISPTYDLGLTIARLSRGSRVGIEDIRVEDWVELNEDLEKLFLLDKEMGLHMTEAPRYPLGGYWEDVTRICKSFGHEVVLLDDKRIWLEHSRAILEREKTKMKFMKLNQDDKESEKDYHKKFIRLNEELWAKELVVDEIHALRRDEQLLRRIASENLALVGVGIGHSDYWMANPGVLAAHGIIVDNYSTDSVSDWDEIPSRLVFTQNASPNRLSAQETINLQRSVRLLRTGRISDKKPDYVGTWDVHQPSRGYFELFIDKKTDDRVEGRIEDLLGSATFVGDFCETFTAMDKVYIRRGRGAAETPVSYIGERKGESVIGTYQFEKGRGPFYMEEFKEGRKPIDLALKHFELFIPS